MRISTQFCDGFRDGFFEKLADVVSEDGIIASTIGRLEPSYLLRSLVLGTPSDIINVGKSSKKSRKERVALANNLINELGPELAPSKVRIGHSAPFEDSYRLLTDKELAKRRSLFARALAIPPTLLSGMYSGLTRADHYNPYTDTVVSYHKDPAVLRHEFGHAEDINSRDYPSLYAASRLFGQPFTNIPLEIRATENALKRIPSTEEKERATDILTPALGTYLGAAVGSAAALFSPPKISPLVRLAAPFVGAGVGHLFNRPLTNLFWGDELDKDKDKDTDK